jgi:hypothetical protein
MLCLDEAFRTGRLNKIIGAADALVVGDETDAEFDAELEHMSEDSIPYPVRSQHRTLLFVGSALLAAGAIWSLSYLYRRGRRTPADCRPGTAARREGEGDIRSAGPDGMRSTTRRAWTKVDEASDESFPASDPPAF